MIPEVEPRLIFARCVAPALADDPTREHLAEGGDFRKGQPRWRREQRTADPNDIRQPKESQAVEGPQSSPDGWPRCRRCASWFRKRKPAGLTDRLCCVPDPKVVDPLAGL